jgi:serine/threonine-protein kinase
LEEVSGDPDRLARFQREARVLASLNHPNIATLYGFEEDADTSFLVMELVRGETLADRIARGPVPLAEAIPLFLQIAEGLEAAHESGVIHRDLKPANIKISDDASNSSSGRVGGSAVKILDFGLAKAIAGESGKNDSNLTQSPTLTLAATQRGEVMGTAAYMSPEQAAGKIVDRRTDIWAFGVCLYEALTGSKMFRADDVVSTLAAVLRDEVEWASLPPSTPASVRRLLARCLERDRSRRLQHLGDARLELEEAKRHPEADPGYVLGPTAPRRSIVQTAAIAGVAAALAAFGVWLWLSTSPPSPPRAERFRLTSPSDPVWVATSSADVAISPDGTRVVYKANGPHGALALRDLADLSITPLVEEWVFGPVVSPDGQWVAFNDTIRAAILKVSILGGPPVEVSTAGRGSMLGISWGSDDTLVFGITGQTGLQRVSAAGGEPESLTTPQEKTESHGWPDILPGNRAVLFTILKPDAENAQVALLDFETGEARVLLPNGFHARYVGSGHVLYAAAGALWAVAFDLERLAIEGEPTRVLEDVVFKSSGAVSFDVADDGTLVYVRGESSGVGRRRLVWVDRQGRAEELPAPPRPYLTPRISPDGSRIAVQQMGFDNELWIWDSTQQALSRLTFDREWDRGPVWTPDGSSIFFTSARDGVSKIYRRSADGAGTAVKMSDRAVRGARDISPDGQVLVFETARGLEALTLDGSGDESLVLDDPLASGTRISPDGRWIAYQSRESGTGEVYVRPFPDAAQGRWQVSAGGGIDPVWSSDGRELFYRTATDLMQVLVEPADSFRVGAVDALFPTNIVSLNNSYDVTPDGQRFLMIRPSEVENGMAPELVLVKNWFEELKRLAPSG